MKRHIMMTVEAPEGVPVEEMVEGYLHSQGIEVIDDYDDDEEIDDDRYHGPFSRMFLEGGSPKPGDVERYERALDALEPFEATTHYYYAPGKPRQTYPPQNT